MRGETEWGEAQFAQVDQPIVAEFEEAEGYLTSFTTIVDSKFDPDSSFDPALNYSANRYMPSFTCDFECSLGYFIFTLDSEGNATIRSFFAEAEYIKLPSEVYDTSGCCHVIKRIDGIYGGNVLKGLWIPEGVEIIAGNFHLSHSLLDVFLPQSLACFGSMFWRVPQFEDGNGGAIWFPGDPDQWAALKNSDKMREMMDYTPYDDIVRFYEASEEVRIPLLDIVYCEANKNESVLRVCNKSGDLVVASNGNGRMITSIGRRAFACNNGLLSVTISPEVSLISTDAFYGCTNLQSLIIMAATDELIIEDGAFFGCARLTTIEVKRNVKIGSRAFALPMQNSPDGLLSPYKGGKATTFIIDEGIELRYTGENAFLNRPISDSVNFQTPMS